MDTEVSAARQPDSEPIWENPMVIWAAEAGTEKPAKAKPAKALAASKVAIDLRVMSDTPWVAGTSARTSLPRIVSASKATFQ
ncbi:MAG: hypothetical protein ABWY18_17350 [Tardiphaga sp.]